MATADATGDLEFKTSIYNVILNYLAKPDTKPDALFEAILNGFNSSSKGIPENGIPSSVSQSLFEKTLKNSILSPTGIYKDVINATIQKAGMIGSTSIKIDETKKGFEKGALFYFKAPFVPNHNTSDRLCNAPINRWNRDKLISNMMQYWWVLQLADPQAFTFDIIFCYTPCAAPGRSLTGSGNVTGNHVELFKHFITESKTELITIENNFLKIRSPLAVYQLLTPITDKIAGALPALKKKFNGGGTMRENKWRNGVASRKTIKNRDPIVS